LSWHDFRFAGNTTFSGWYDDANTSKQWVPMPRYKVLKSVAHNIGHSFTSLMNYAEDDYTMGHILKFARETGANTLTIDFVTGKGQPAALLREPICEVPRWYAKMFWDLVATSGSEPSMVQKASLTLRYDLAKSRSGPPVESPYACDVSILDDRGKHYEAHFEGWWYIEKNVLSAPTRRWWNLLSWFRGGPKTES
jgi:hypothetical protein